MPADDTVPTEGVLLLQEPPEVALARVMHAPVHTSVGPDIVSGGVLMVKVVVTLAVQYPPYPADIGSCVPLSV